MDFCLCSPVVGQAAVVFNSRIQTLGRYAFILHFYQPQHPSFPVEVLINGGRIWQGEKGRDLGELLGARSLGSFSCQRMTEGSLGITKTKQDWFIPFQTGRV